MNIVLWRINAYSCLSSYSLSWMCKDQCQRANIDTEEEANHRWSSVVVDIFVVDI